jgi:hypothetical protein
LIQEHLFKALSNAVDCHGFLLVVMHIYCIATCINIIQNQ